MKYRLIIFSLALATPFAAHAEFTWNLLKQPSFKSSYLKVLGQKRSESWLASLSGPSDEVVHRTIQGKDYLLANSCKQHWCNTNNVVLAYSPASKRVFVKLVEDGTVIWLGAPETEVKTALESYYDQRFGKK